MVFWSKSLSSAINGIKERMLRRRYVAEEIIALIGPSFVGKSTYANQLVADRDLSYSLISFSRYREFMPANFSEKIATIALYILNHKYTLLALVYLAIFERRERRIVRTLYYTYVEFALVRSRPTLKAKFLYDEVFIKKLLDGIPTPVDYTDYQRLKTRLAEVHKLIVSNYLRDRGHVFKYRLLFNSYYTSKQRGMLRATEQHPFIERNFRKRICLEMRLYQALIPILEGKRVEVELVKTV